MCSGVSRVLLEGVPNGEESIHLLPKQAQCSGTPEHNHWTHGSAELQGNRPKLAGVQVSIIDKRVTV